MDAASGVGHDRQPTPGDYSACLDCGALLRFGPALVLTLCTACDLVELAKADPPTFATLQKAQMLVRLHALKSTISTPRPPAQSG